MIEALTVAYFGIGAWMVLRTEPRGFVADFAFATLWPVFVLRHLIWGF